jgi:DNA-binding transcriptional ArsR family regulator
MTSTIYKPESLSACLKALGHPVRLQIIQLLDKAEGGLNVKTIHLDLNIQQPDASRHLGILKHHGLVRSVKKDGQSIYSLNRGNTIVDLVTSMLGGRQAA